MEYKYYQDTTSKLPGGEQYHPSHTVFVTLGEGYFSTAHDGEHYIQTYSPMGQHGEATYDYVKECKEITKEEYIRLSEGLYTPEEYIR